MKQSERKMAYDKVYRATHKEQSAAYQRAYYQTHRAHRRAQGKAYYQTHQEERRAREAGRVGERRAYDRVYYQAHKDKKRQYYIAWRKKNPGAELARHMRRRGIVGQSHTTVDMVTARWQMYGGMCWICGGGATDTDHVKPLAKGGAHLPCNLRPICGSCNSKKKDKWPYPVTSQNPGPQAGCL